MPIGNSESNKQPNGGTNRKAPIGDGELESRMRAFRDADAEAMTREDIEEKQAKAKEDWRKSTDLSGIEDGNMRKKALDALSKYVKM